jgi:hypothetical protein
MENSVTWKRGLPTEPGFYWFKSYRYGIHSCGDFTDPEIIMIEVFATSGKSVAVKGNGQFVFKSEFDIGYHTPVDIPFGPPLPNKSQLEKMFGEGVKNLDEKYKETEYQANREALVKEVETKYNLGDIINE